MGPNANGGPAASASDRKDAGRKETIGLDTLGLPVTPSSVKIAVVKHFVQASRYKTFIETGTFLGTTLEVVARTGIHCYSIEYDEALFNRAKSVLGRFANISLINGDSAVELPAILKSLREPAVFWLDGHFSGGITSRSQTDTPIDTEINAILKHPIRDHIILIDDAREFNGVNGYPRLSSLLQRVDETDVYAAEVSTDIIRICNRSLSI